MMEHPLHTISYVADIDNVLVVMAHVIPTTTEGVPQSPVTTPTENKVEPGVGYTPKMTCHVLDTENVSLLFYNFFKFCTVTQLILISCNFTRVKSCDFHWY